MFALHDVNLYSRDRREGINQDIAGELDFPGEKQLDCWDFVYFSFTLGMTSQVTGIAVTFRSLRELTFAHGVLSFFFNSTILVMSINIIPGSI